MSLLKSQKKLEKYDTPVLEQTEDELKKAADFMFTGSVLNMIAAFNLIEHHIERSPLILMGLGVFCIMANFLLQFQRKAITDVVNVRPDKSRHKANRPIKK